MFYTTTNLLRVDFHSDIASFDYFYVTLQFKDGDQADSPVLSRFCGSTVPEMFYTTTNLLRADFHSDLASFGRGFLFNWEATTDQPVTTTIASSTTQGSSVFQNIVFGV